MRSWRFQPPAGDESSRVRKDEEYVDPTHFVYLYLLRERFGFRQYLVVSMSTILRDPADGFAKKNQNNHYLLFSNTVPKRE
jgi:hypothetical protein